MRKDRRVSRRSCRGCNNWAGPMVATSASTFVGQRATPVAFTDMPRELLALSPDVVLASGTLAQQVQVYFATPADTMEYIKAGRLRALAVTGATRTQAVPDVPTIAEFVPGYEAVGWLGIVAPKDTPVAIIDMLNNTINAGLADPKIKQTIADWGETVFASSPAEFGKFLAAETAKWGTVIRPPTIKL